MPKVTLANLYNSERKIKEGDKLERQVIDAEFEVISSKVVTVEEKKLIPTIYEFGRTLGDDELYRMTLSEKVCILVNGEVKPVESWSYTYLTEYDEVFVIPAFGKAIIKAIVGVILIVVGIVVGVVWGWTGVGGVWAGTLIGSGVGLLLGAIADWLFSPDLPVLPELSSGDDNLVYSWSGIRSVAKADIPVAVIVGTHKVGINIISAYFKTIGKDSYLYMLGAIGEGVIDGICAEDDYTVSCSTSDSKSSAYKHPAIFVNEQPLSNYDDVKWWARYGYNEEDGTKDQYYPYAQNPIPNFNDVRIAYADRREVTVDGVIYTTKTEVDKALIIVACPGLYKLDDDGRELNKCSISYKVEYKQTIDSEWTPVTIDSFDCVKACHYYRVDDDGNASCAKYTSTTVSREDCNNKVMQCQITNPTYYGYKNATPVVLIQFSDSSTRVVSSKSPASDLRLKVMNRYNYYYTTEYHLDDGWSGWQEIIYGIIVVFSIFDIKSNKTSTVSKNILPERKVVQNIGPWGEFFGETITWEYPETVTYSFGEFIVTFTLTSLEIGQEFNFYALESPDEDSWRSVSAATRSPISFNCEVEFPSNAQYDIKISRQNEVSTSLMVSNQMSLSEVVEIISDHLIYPNTALVAFSMKATGQLSGTSPNVTLVVRGLKIQVPQMSSGDFDDCYWDNDDERWEDQSGTEVTWDGTTYVEQYSENALAHIHNMFVNTRYGMGKYISSDDINYSYFVEALKACHLSYNPRADAPVDFTDWWQNGTNRQFLTNVKLNISSAGVYGTTSFDILSITNSNRRITIVEQGSLHINYHFTFFVKLDEPLKKGKPYVVTVSFTGSSSRSRVKAIVSGVNWYSITDTSSESYRLGVYNGTFNGTSLTININSSNYASSGLMISIKDNRGTSWDYLEGSITNVSVSVAANTHISHFHEANGVFDRSQSADTAVAEFCHSFRLFVIYFNGKICFKSNEDDTPAHTINMSNIKEGTFKQEFSPISSIPRLIEGQYCNASRGFEMETLPKIIPIIGLNEASKKQFGFKFITDSVIITRELIFHANSLANGVHAVNFEISSEYIHATAGDIIWANHQLPAWGGGVSGRVIDFNVLGATVTLSIPIVISDRTKTYKILVQTSDNDFEEGTLDLTGVSNGDSLDTVTVVSWFANGPFVDGTYMVGIEELYNKKFRLMAVKRTTENRVNCVAMEHYSANYTLQDIQLIDVDASTLPDPTRKSRITDFEVTEIIDGYNNSKTGFVFQLKSNKPVDGYEVQMSLNYEGPYSAITHIGEDGTGTYFNDSLIKDKTYYFKVIAKSGLVLSSPAFALCKLSESVPNSQSPSGLKIVGEARGITTFDTRNVTITWNAINGAVRYRVNIYKNTKSAYNLLTSEEVNDNSIRYTVANNRIDSGGTPSSTLVFEVAGINASNRLLKYSNPFTISNNVPDDLTDITGNAVTGGVNFTWKASEEEDHLVYRIRIKVGSDSWGSWFDHTSNSYECILNYTQIQANGTHPNIVIEVKDKDCYEQLSANAATTSVYASSIIDNIFGIKITVSGGTGISGDLINGDLDSGGITFSS